MSTGEPSETRTLRPGGSPGATHPRRRRTGVIAALVLAFGVAGCSGTASDTGPAVATTTVATVALPTTSFSIADIPATEAPPEPPTVECVESLSTGVSMAVCDHVVYDIGIPDECPAEGCGLIVDFHPSNMTSADTDAHTNMQALGMAAGYVVVQPNNPAGAAAATLVRRVLDALIAALALDPTRVHVGGASLGGFMTWHFVCDHSDLIASAAPHASGAGNLPGESCDFDEGRSPSEQVDILMMHGRNDPTVPFSRGIEQRDLVLEAWDMDRSEVVVNGPEHLWTRWTNEQGTVVEFVEFDWESAATFGHCYPGADGRGGCGADNPVHYGEAALAFYLAHPKDG